TAAVYARSGGAAGTGWARRVAEAFLSTALHPPSSTGRAAFVGAADGFLFLGILGLVGGALLGKSGRNTDELLVPIVVGSVLLVGGAIFVGTLAHALTYGGAVFLYSFASSLLGWFLAFILLGPDYAVGGIGAGATIGMLLCNAVRLYSPKFQPPRVSES